MRVEVYPYYLDPEKDRRSHCVSRNEAVRLIATGAYYYVHQRAIKAYPPPEMRIAGAGFSDAWKIKPSACVPVWQMVTR